MNLKRNQIFKLCALMILHGGLLVAIFFSAIMMRYENQLLDSIINKTVTQGMSDREKALVLLNTTHKLLKPRQELFAGDTQRSIREQFFPSADTHLMSAKGACGSYAGVLTRILQRIGIESRLAQMKCQDQWGCHIVLEAKINGKFSVLDPLYNIAFENPQGKLASFKEVGANWDYFKSQTPKNYYSNYQYQDVRYTNWQKIPILMPLIKKGLTLVMGEQANDISIRSYVLNIYQVYLVFFIFLFLILIVFSYKVFRNFDF